MASEYSAAYDEVTVSVVHEVTDLVRLSNGYGRACMHQLPQFQLSTTFQAIDESDDSPIANTVVLVQASIRIV